MPDTDDQIIPPQYKRCVVALVDVLGWSELVKQDCDRPPVCAWKALERLQLEISSQQAAQNSGRRISSTGPTMYQRTLADEHTTQVWTSGHPNPDDVHLSQFSDHLLLSCDAEGSAPADIIDRISNLLWAMLAGGLFVRGAVVVGKLLHSSSLALGPALVHAHHLESEVAFYPRVIVDDSVQRLIEEHHVNRIDLPSWIGKPVQRAEPLRRDRDGLLYIDFLRRRLIDGQDVDEIETWHSIRDSLVARRDQHANSPRILAKDNWMITYFNDVVRGTPPLGSLEIQQL